MKSKRKEINDLLEKRVFELITINVVLRDVRIFNFRFVNEIKHSDIADVYGKFRLMIQVYNDHDKTLMFISSLVIQRMSQWIILVITACIFHCHFYLRDITQTYVQSKIFWIKNSSFVHSSSLIYQRTRFFESSNSYTMFSRQKHINLIHIKNIIRKSFRWLNQRLIHACYTSIKSIRSNSSSSSINQISSIMSKL